MEPIDAVLTRVRVSTPAPAATESRTEGGPTEESSSEHGGPGDPFIRKLVFVFLGVIALFLAAIASALVFGFLSPARAPRTLIERNVQVFGSQVKVQRCGPRPRGPLTSRPDRCGAVVGSANRPEQGSGVGEDRPVGCPLAAGAPRVRPRELCSFCRRGRKLPALMQRSSRPPKVDELKLKGITQDASKSLPTSWPVPRCTRRATPSLRWVKTSRRSMRTSCTSASLRTDSTILVAKGGLENQDGDKVAARRTSARPSGYIPDYQPALTRLEKMGASANGPQTRCSRR